MTRINKVSGILFFSLLCLQSFPQTGNELWSGGVFKLDINNKNRVEIEQQFRTSPTLDYLDEYLTEIGYRYTLTGYLNFKIFYRHTVENNDLNQYRISGDMNYTWSRQGFPLDFSYRSKIQHAGEYYARSYNTNWRHRLEIDYNMTKLVDPYLSYEAYFRFNQQNKFTTNRYKAGLEWAISNTLDLDTFFIFEDEYGAINPGKKMITGISLSWNLDL